MALYSWGALTLKVSSKASYKLSVHCELHFEALVINDEFSDSRETVSTRRSIINYTEMTTQSKDETFNYQIALVLIYFIYAIGGRSNTFCIQHAEHELLRCIKL